MRTASLATGTYCTTDMYYWRWVQHYRYSTAVLLDPICCTTQHGAAWRCARISAVESVKLMASLGRCNHAIAAESMKLVRKPARRTHACFRSRLGQRLGDDKARSMTSTMTSDDVLYKAVQFWSGGSDDGDDGRQSGGVGRDETGGCDDGGMRATIGWRRARWVRRRRNESAVAETELRSHRQFDCRKRSFSSSWEASPRAPSCDTAITPTIIEQWGEQVIRTPFAQPLVLFDYKIQSDWSRLFS